jgi:hypothetical protein
VTNTASDEVGDGLLFDLLLHNYAKKILWRMGVPMHARWMRDASGSATVAPVG